MNLPTRPTFRPCPCAPVVAFILSLTLLCSGCTMMQNVPLTGPAGPSVVVHPGDFVQVKTKAGQSQSFKVTAMEPDALGSRDVRVRYDDMATLQVRRIDKTLTTIVVVVSVVVVVGAAAAIGASSSVMSGPLFPAGTTF